MNILKKITVFINNVFKPNKLRRGTIIKLYSIIALSLLLFGSECWTIRAKDEWWLTTAEMKVKQRIADFIHNEDRNQNLLPFLMKFQITKQSGQITWIDI